MKKVFLFVVLLFILISPQTVNAQECKVTPDGEGPGCFDYKVPSIVGQGDDLAGAGINTPSCKKVDQRVSDLEVGKVYRICCPSIPTPSFIQASEGTLNKSCSEYMARTAICGSAEETAIGCQYSTDATYLTCWGNNYRRCDPTNADFPAPAEGTLKRQGFLTGGGGFTETLTAGKTYSGTVMYNGMTYPVTGLKVWFCDADVAGCGPAGQTIEGEGESRLWYPHLRLIAALSTMAQAIFNPAPTSLSNNAPPSDTSGSLTNPGVITTRVEKHQGVDDSTVVVNTDTNNSSLITTQVAPSAESLQRWTESPYNDMACIVPEVINNPGDDLLGPKIVGRVLFTQKYDYEACEKKWLTGSCAADGSVTTSPASCCSNQAADPQCHAEATDNMDGTFTCGSPPQVERQTEGKAAVYIKNPLVEYIYDVMVDGSQSLFKRFMPSINTKEFNEIPSSVAYSASALQNTQSSSSVELRTEDGNTPSFYVPHIGSLKKYWLEDLQKALRPEGSSSLPPGTTPAGVCSAPTPSSSEFQNNILGAAQAAGGYAAKVPTSVLKMIYAIEALPFYTGAETYDCTHQNVYLGLMAMGDPLYNAVTQPSDRPDVEEKQCVAIPGKLNRCWPIDTMEIAARALLSKVGKYPNGGSISGQLEVRRATCGYYGSDKADSLTNNFARGYFRGSPELCRDVDPDGNCTNMSYPDIVCLGSGLCDGQNWPTRLNDVCR